jgi:hypothetical protein
LHEDPEVALQLADGSENAFRTWYEQAPTARNFANAVLDAVQAETDADFETSTQPSQRELLARWQAFDPPAASRLGRDDESDGAAARRQMLAVQARRLIEMPYGLGKESQI